ncbi:MAG TPA: histidine kinase [Hymenobacter sp.]|jgi:signal transduction histidine kinase|uniref:sensor histidine kinase n=1 Tax=Hymenobacter sp. TaxID=1898978 RepID=UPI002ED92353
MKAAQLSDSAPRPAGLEPGFGNARLDSADAVEATGWSGITGAGLLLYGVFYLLFGVFYACTIAYSVQDYQVSNLPNDLRRVLLVDYPLKALWTLPVWWLVFRGPLRRVNWPWRLLHHAWLCPLWVVVWLSSYYGAANWLGVGTIRGSGRIWDVYIPVLFYGMQFGALHVVEFIQQLQQRSRLEQALREQAHHSEMAALKAQINPHFLFNTLNSISASVPPELESTRELIVQLAHTFRFALAASRHERLPLGEELAFLKDYLALEQVRFGARLQVEIDADERLLDQLVPPMLVQPLVENAVRHGLAPSVAGGRLIITAVPEGRTALRITVADTGQGVANPAALLAGATGLGLRNTHARLRALGVPGLEISSNTPHGLQVSFVLPLSAPLAAVAAAPVATPEPTPA